MSGCNTGGFGVSRPRSTLMFACFIPCVSYRNAQNHWVCWVCWVALCFCMGFSIPTTGYDWVWLGIFPLVLPSNTQSYPVNTQWKRYYWVWLYPAWLLALWRFLWGHTQHTQYFHALCVIRGSTWMVVNLAEKFQMVVAGTKNPALGGVVWVSRRPSLPAGRCLSGRRSAPCRSIWRGSALSLLFSASRCRAGFRTRAALPHCWRCRIFPL